jgi:hypothetical protein
MRVKTDSPSILAEKMVRILRQRKERGESDNPLTLEQLAKLADPAATTPTIVRAVAPARKAFKAHAIAARQELGAPLALHEDVPHLAASPVLLLFALGCARTPTNHAVSVAEIKRKLTSKLQAAFQEALQQRIAAESLPPSVGWVLMNRAKKLFLLTDLHTGREQEKIQATEISAEPSTQYSVLSTQYSVPSIPAPPSRIGADFDAVFARLDRQGGGHNFVNLVDLRRELSLGREEFNAELRQLRLSGSYTLSAAEGRHGLSSTEQEAGIVEDGTLLLYVSRKSP